MSMAGEMSRGFFLKARLAVNGIQNALKSFGTSARGAAFTAATVFIGKVSSGRSLARTMTTAPLFVQFSVAQRRTLRKASVDPAPRSRKDGAPDSKEALLLPGLPLRDKS